ncbi:DUF2301 domain-containing membrane protein [Aliivibrio fischeri]|uniref:DUF2301 domain-containing membrane protein n=1 Tax=Aliivibrio fischeri TaxID=668 RepID=UPI0007C5D9EB|nr:DUF2301 domain-containing membrane protein [Aliivibrio fischeri]MCE7535369.1 DUF2301 domain-containing membrane protein [Aliivibrio fischeri]MCE7558264.1 DUF2301 domain-containing membrane protein [Aliivibrio fischeri]MCE7566649.1 DUF2301 domain-containing membrane protein [Aliivibrio fischeri]
MASIDHIEKLDALDKLSVVTYRTGITLFGIALILFSLAIADDIGLIIIENVHLMDFSLTLIAVSSAMSAANLHVYDKKVRLIITWAAWIGLVLLITIDSEQLVWLPIGFLCACFSGIALKESFCFKVIGLKAIPFLLCISILMLAIEIWLIAIICLFLSGIIFIFLAIQKWKMPLHFDIGNKANYQI